jgi:hypothetical protein
LIVASVNETEAAKAHEDLALRGERKMDVFVLLRGFMTSWFRLVGCAGDH